MQESFLLDKSLLWLSIGIKGYWALNPQHLAECPRCVVREQREEKSWKGSWKCEVLGGHELD